MLTAPNALPAVPHGGMRKGWKACGYTVLFNLVGRFSTRVFSSVKPMIDIAIYFRSSITQQVSFQ